MNLLVICTLLSVSAKLSFAQGPPPPEPPVRELFIPFNDLHTVLEGQPRRVLLTRKEYTELMAQVKKTEEAHPPITAALISAEYAVEVAAERATLTGKLGLEVLEDGMHVVPLDLSGVGLAAATLDDRSVAIGRADDGRLTLFVAGKGRHVLTLTMTAPVQTTADQQTLNVRLATPATATISLAAPGDVEVKSGAAVVRRAVGGEPRVTRFELLAKRGDLSIVMSLNSRLRRQDRVVVAREVLVDEVTQAYERLHATVSFAVLHQAIDQARFVVPEGFEPTAVTSEYLARWAVVQEDGRRILDVRFREATTDTVVLNVSALRSPARADDWTMPKLEPLDVVGQVAVVGLLVEDRLQAETLVASGLLAIDTEALTQALPASVFQAEPGAPTIRPVAAFYAPQGDFAFTAAIGKPAPNVRATTNLLLLVGEEGHEVHGGFALLADVEPLHSFDFTAPVGWQVDHVTGEGDKPLLFDRFGAADGSVRIHVRLPGGVRPGTTYTVHFAARHTPPGWLEEWPRSTVTFPVFAVEGAARDVGAIAVVARGDLTTRPDTLEGLTPLAEQEKAKYGLAGVATNLAYHYDSQPYQATLTIERTPARLTAQTYSFLRVEPAALAAHYEVVYEISGAGVRTLALSLPASTPAALSIAALDGVGIKEFISQDDADSRRWTVQLTERREGTVKLAVDFQQPLTSDEQAELKLPIVQAEGVVYQSGAVAVEGSPDLDVEVLAHPRKLDVGELVDAHYQPGKRLLGAFGFVGNESDVTIRVARPTLYALQPVIVERAELKTFVSAQGASQTDARFMLRSKAQYLEVVLPTGSRLWSTAVDGQPTKPQREGNRLLVGLPAGGNSDALDLTIVYETKLTTIDLSGNIDLAAPSLMLRADGDSQSTPIPLVELVWYLHLPNGYRVMRSDGTVISDDVRPPDLAALNVARWLWDATGGIGNGLLFLPAVKRAQEAARHPGKDDVQYYSPLGDRRDGRAAVLASPKHAQPPTNALDIYGNRIPDASDSMQADDAAAPLTAAPDEKSMGGAQQLASPSAPVETKGEAMAAPAKAPPPPATQGRWALEGVRSLKIDLAASSEPVKFTSLGEGPRINVSVAHRRVGATGWAIALAIVLRGMYLTNRPGRTKTIYIAAISVAATLVSLVSTTLEVVLIANQAFYAASVLAIWYLLAAVVHWLSVPGRAKSVAAKSATAAAVLLMAISATAVESASAQEANPANVPIVVQVEPPGPPVVVPADAILVPFDPSEDVAPGAIDQILVPYDKYRELWEQAHPDDRSKAKPPPAAYAAAGAAYHATLAGDEFLAIEGSIEFDVYVEGHVSIPLAVEGGVLATAELDGKPARLHVVRVDPHQSVPAGNTVNPVVLLDIEGQGRHRLDLTVRLRLERRGGWRVAGGRLPLAPATGLVLQVPQPSTEVRLGGVMDRPAHETERADETIRTALAQDGALQIQWRPKVDQGLVDRNLTARSTAAFDVQEDSLRLTWQLTLEFPRSTRDAFSLRIPRDYLVERVEGNNVRGWEVKPAEADQTIDVTLLNTARDAESIAIVLVRHGAIGRDALAGFAAPFVTADGAALHTGVLAIRRSPGLDVRTAEVSGVKRTDFPPDMGVGAQRAAQESPLGIVPFQAYQFAGTPFGVELTVAPLAPRATARVETVLKIAARERTLETRITLDVQGRPIHRVRLAVPADCQLDQVVAPGRFEWTRTEDAGRSIVTVRLAAGQLGQSSLVLAGVLGEAESVERLALPKIEVLDVERQQGDIAVQVDPAFDVEAADLANCAGALVSSVFGWLRVEQREATRLVLHYETPEYGGELRLRTRQALVSGVTITNVRVTGAAVEATILLDFTIREAGVREISFLLPAELRDARISAPMLRTKSIEAVPDDAAGRVRVRLELQDDVMDQLRVLVEHESALSAREYEAPLPTLETGRAERRYVALQSAGRDEVLVVSQDGLEALGRQQASFQRVAQVLGGRLTRVYLVNPGAAAPRLTFKTQDRQTVETAGARIGLAETRIVVDGQGTYRAAQIYRLDNSTEQYLELQMPEGASLWTALVAGEPAKPVQVAGAGLTRVRIPLVKTVAGDLDYEVALKYGGSLAALGKLTNVSFPMIRTVNIHVEQSQVRLYLPETQQWFDFGGTLGRVADEAELQAGFLNYSSKLVARLAQVVGAGDAYARARATNNLKQLSNNLQGYTNPSAMDAQTGLAGNEAWKQEAFNATRTLEAAEKQAQSQSAAQVVEEDADNRGNLSRLYVGQETRRSKNVVNELGTNFATVPQTAVPPDSGKGQEFNDAWFRSNELNQPAEQPAAGKAYGGRSVAGVNAPVPESAPAQWGGQQPLNPGVAQGEAKEQLKLQGDDLTKQADRKADGEQGRVMRYQQRLEQQVAQQPPRQQPPAPQGGAGGLPAPATSTVAPINSPMAGEVSGLASLDFALPACGLVYRFATPRGEVELTARAVSSELVDRLRQLALALAALVVLLVVYRLLRRGWFATSLGSTIAIFGGLISICVGLLPGVGLVALVGGVVVKVRRWWTRVRK
jgi:hypothetical protein